MVRFLGKGRIGQTGAPSRNRFAPKRARPIGNSNDCKNHHGARLRGNRHHHRHPVPKTRRQRDRLHSGRPQRRPLAFRVCIRHVVLLGRHLRRLRRSIRMEIRPVGHVGRHRQRHFGQPARLVGARPPHARNDTAPGCCHHARILRQALSQPRAAHRRRRHHLRVPHSLHRERLQRPVAPVRHGVRPAVRGMRHRHGTYHLHLRGARRLHGHRGERLPAGHRDAVRHHRRNMRRARRQWRLLTGGHRPVARASRNEPRFARRVREHVRTRFAQPARRCGSHEPRYVGPSANGAEVLRHQKRPRH